ncbi:hypothetical protein [Halegenticoccus soli]|uniref:hypothetical protein n=1 Tax=Halegenticoccus soli TaxID=1985678 RepID=UPI000C6D04AE|nr:hypothetical protein [Halegenticoccus soli]
MGTPDTESWGDEPTGGPPPAADSWLDAFEEIIVTMERRPEVVECTFEDVRVDVPMGMGEEAASANWRLDGTVRVRVEEWTRPLVQWLRWWRQQTRTERARDER